VFEEGTAMKKSLIDCMTKRSLVAWPVWWLLMSIVSINTINYAAASEAKKAPSLVNQSLQAPEIRSLAASALANAAQVRAKVHDGKKDHLWDYIARLNTLIALIKAARPTGEIDALIIYYQQHLAFEDNKQVLADMLPLYHALDALPQNKLTEKARQQLDTVRTALQNGKRADALKALDNMQRTLNIDGVDFPLQAAEEKLRTITNQYEDNRTVPKGTVLLGLETDLLQLVNAL
jgi:hypothetical protein